MLLHLLKQLEERLPDNPKPFVWPDSTSKLVNELVSTMFEFPEKPKGFRLEVLPFKTYKTIVLVSGGMDSSIMWWLNRNKKDKKALYVDLGLDYSNKESEAIAKLKIEPLQIVSYAQPRDANWGHIVPARNYLLIALANEFVSNNGEIWIGAVEGESAKDKGDKSEKFFRLCEKLILQTSGKKVKIRTLKNKTKNDWLKLYLAENGDKKILDTITCYGSTAKGCGKCQACVRKWIALRYCKIETSPYFEQDPFIGGVEFIEKYRKAFFQALKKKDFSHYSKKRVEQDLKVILDYEGKLRF